MLAKYFPVVLASMWLTGCVIDVSTGPTQHYTRDFAREGVERLRLSLRMGAGEVNVRGGAKNLANASFTYNVEDWKPEVRFHNTGGSADLAVEQPKGVHAKIGHSKYTWDLQAADDIPLEVTANLGAGEARLNLGGMALRRVEVEMGVGELQLDLRGKTTHDYNVRVHGGVGEATVRLPQDVGIYATAKGGIGGIHVEGLHKVGDHWVNDIYDRATVRIHVDVEGGVGQINLIAE